MTVNDSAEWQCRPATPGADSHLVETNRDTRETELAEALHLAAAGHCPHPAGAGPGIASGIRHRVHRRLGLPRALRAHADAPHKKRFT